MKRKDEKRNPDENFFTHSAKAILNRLFSSEKMKIKLYLPSAIELCKIVVILCASLVLE